MLIVAWTVPGEKLVLEISSVLSASLTTLVWSAASKMLKFSGRPMRAA